MQETRVVVHILFGSVAAPRSNPCRAIDFDEIRFVANIQALSSCLFLVSRFIIIVHSQSEDIPAMNASMVHDSRQMKQ